MNKVKFDHPTIERMFTCACGHDRSVHAWNHEEHPLASRIPCRGTIMSYSTLTHPEFAPCEKRCTDFQTDNLEWLLKSR